ncbi:MAG: glycosyltransferase [Candidatus Eisenbacteria bacterium]|uniref:Glycosyltransferase n=1 Tax=Eiseniibacteriota bacterium TaxID=2212470 RepID=A0A937XBE5_UNCEI|nr:glycosyltransferase [Candidatus Eisenbacteria bacterium]
MKIVYIGTAHPMRGGIAHFNAILARELAERHEVRFLSFTRQYPGLFFPGKTQFVADPGGAPQPAVAARAVLDSIDPLSWLRTARLAAAERPDLLLFKYWMPFFAPAFGTIIRRVKRRLPARALFVCDNVIPHERRPLDGALTRYALGPADGFVVLSAAVRDDLLAVRPDARWRLVPHPIYDIFGARGDKAAARRELGLGEGPWLLFFGYVRRYKGLDLIIEALPRIRERVPVRLLVAGEFYEGEARYRERVRELGLGDAVRFDADYIPESRVPLYFSAADAAVLPYHSATQSGIVQVAYHLDTPVLCTAVGGLHEVVREGRTGFVVPPEDVPALAQAVIRFYEEGWEERLRAGVREVKGEYSWAPLVRAIEELARDDPDERGGR